MHISKTRLKIANFHSHPKRQQTTTSKPDKAVRLSRKVSIVRTFGKFARPRRTSAQKTFPSFPRETPPPGALRPEAFLRHPGGGAGGRAGYRPRRGPPGRAAPPEGRRGRASPSITGEGGAPRPPANIAHIDQP